MSTRFFCRKLVLITMFNALMCVGCTQSTDSPDQLKTLSETRDSWQEQYAKQLSGSANVLDELTDEELAQFPRLTNVFSDNFSADTRAHYETTGEVHWEDGRLMLNGTSSISRKINGGTWVEVDLSFEAPQQKNEDIVYEFRWGLAGATDCIIRWNKYDEENADAQYQLLILDLKGGSETDVEPTVVRKWPLASLDAGKWRLAYRNGLVTISRPGNTHDKSGADYMAYINNGAATVAELGFTSQRKETGVSVRSYHVASSSPTRILSADEKDQLSKLSARAEKASELFSKYDYSGAADLYRKLLPEYAELVGITHPAFTRTLNSLGRALRSMRQYQQAEEPFRKALIIRRQLLGTLHPDYALSVHNLAALRWSQNRYEQAQQLFLEARDIRKHVFGRESYEYASTVSELGSAYEERDEVIRATDSYRESLEIFEKVSGREDSGYTSVLLKLARLYSNTGRLFDAESLYKQIIELKQRAGRTKDLDYANSLRDFANFYIEAGQYSKAKPLIEQAVRIGEETVGIEHPMYGNIISVLAHYYESMKDYVQAAPLREQALKIAENAFGKEHPSYADNLKSFATVQVELGNLENGETAFREALQIQQKQSGAKDMKCLGILHGLARIQEKRRKYPEAESLYVDVVNAIPETQRKHNSFYATVTNNLGLLYLKAGFPDRAEFFLQDSLKIKKQIFGDKYYRNAVTLQNLGVLYKTLAFHGVSGAHQRAATCFHECTEITRLHLEESSLVQSERQQFAMLKWYRPFLDANFWIPSLGPEFRRQQYQEVLRWKGSVFFRQQALRRLRQSDDLEVQRLLRDLTEIARKRATKILQVPKKGDTERWKTELATLRVEQEKLESRLSAVSREFRKGMYAVQATPEEIQAILSPGTVLIDFFEYQIDRAHQRPWPWGIAAFIVTNQKITYVEVCIRKDVQSLIADWRREISRGGGGDSISGKQLRERIWEPLSEHVGDASIVLISPDSILQRLPFAALPGQQSGSYLIEEKQIITVPFAQMLKLWQNVEDQPKLQSVLAVGGVDFNGMDLPAPRPESEDQKILVAKSDKTRAVIEEGDRLFTDLPGSRKEVEMLMSIHHKMNSEGVRQKLSGIDASEAAVRKNASGKDIIHFATHGFFASPNHISAARYQTEATKVKSYLPGVLSGVALAGANRPLPPDDSISDDGILTASEVQELHLEGTELVVLSACDTGLGEVAGGEGVLGLQRAFHMAGARNVVTSLWKVNDDATAALMSLFYHNLCEKKQSPPEALRNAQLALLNSPDVIGDGQRLSKLISRGLDFNNPKKVDTNAKPAPQTKRTPIHLWAAFTHSGPPPMIVP